MSPLAQSVPVEPIVIGVVVLVSIPLLVRGKSLLDTLPSRLQPFLDPDEKLQQAFPATAGVGPPMGFLVLGAIISWVSVVFLPFFARQRVVAVTDRGILIFKADLLYGTTPKKLMARLVRDEPCAWKRGLISGRLDVGDFKLYVHRKSFPRVEAILPEPAL